MLLTWSIQFSVGVFKNQKKEEKKNKMMTNVVDITKKSLAKVLTDWIPEPHNHLPQCIQNIKLFIVLWYIFCFWLTYSGIFLTSAVTNEWLYLTFAWAGTHNKGIETIALY